MLFHIISTIFGNFCLFKLPSLCFWLTYHYHHSFSRWKPFDPARNWPDLGPRFSEGERIARQALHRPLTKPRHRHSPDSQDSEDRVEDDRRDLDWATVLKRSFESYIRGERPNMYGEALRW